MIPPRPRPLQRFLVYRNWRRTQSFIVSLESTKFDRLVNHTIQNINGIRKDSYWEALAVARHVYGGLPDDEVWYRDYFRKTVGEALDENMEIVDSPSNLEPCSGNHLAW